MSNSELHVRNIPASSRLSVRLLISTVALIAVLFGASGPSGAQVLNDDSDIGTVPAAGSSSCASGVYTIKGSGAGVNIGASDAYNFAYTQITSGGNFRLVARVTGFSFSVGSVASIGLVVRQDLGPADSIGAIACWPGSSWTGLPNDYQAMFRDTVASPPLARHPSGRQEQAATSPRTARRLRRRHAGCNLCAMATISSFPGHQTALRGPRSMTLAAVRSRWVARSMSAFSWQAAPVQVSPQQPLTTFRSIRTRCCHVSRAGWQTRLRPPRPVMLRMELLDSALGLTALVSLNAPTTK